MPSEKFEVISKTLVPTFGEWTFFRLPLGQPLEMLHTMLHDLESFKEIFNNVQTESIVECLIADTKVWLQDDPQRAVAAAKLSSRLRLKEPHTLSLESNDTSLHSILGYEEARLKLTLDVVEQVAEFHSKRDPLPGKKHIDWIDDSEDFSTLETCMNRIVSHPFERGAFLRLMRGPGMYDGCIDYVYERFMRVAISLMFAETGRLRWLDSPHSSHDSPHPLVVACSDDDDDPTTLEAMAKSAQPTLVKLVTLHRKEDDCASPSSAEILPAHCIVYGFHLSKLCTRIFAHFPVDTHGDDPTQWKFCQVLVAEHWSGLEELKKPRENARYEVYSEDECLLVRWRLTIALFAIRYRVLELEKVLQGEIGVGKDIETGSLPASTTTSNLLVQSFDTASMHIRQYLDSMRAFWRNEKIVIPAPWIPQLGEKLMVTPSVWDEDRNLKQYARHLLLPLAKLVLYPIREMLTPLPSDPAERVVPDIEPDFTNSVHMPRHRFRWGEMRDNRYIAVSTLVHYHDPHLTRVYDLLTMTLTSWRDLSIFLAYVFSAFHGFFVKWHPQTRYPFEMETTPHDTLDFAVAAQFLLPASTWNIKRGYRSPLTLSTPAVVLCFTAKEPYLELEAITEDELIFLKHLVAPHLRMVSMGVGQEGRTDWPAWATLFLLYIKAGAMHIITCTSCWDGERPLVDLYLLDTIPVERCVREPIDTESRLRLTIALLTIRSHAQKFSERWSEIEWEESLLAAEDDAIMIATGMESTQTRSEGRSEDFGPSARELADMVEALGRRLTEIGDDDDVQSEISEQSISASVVPINVDSWVDDVISSLMDKTCNDDADTCAGVETSE